VIKKEGEDKPEQVPTDVTHLIGKSGIPDFWFRAMKNNQMIWELVKEKDEEILKHITNIESERSDKPKSLKITLHFSDNDYFEDKTLSLKIVYKGESDEVQSTEGSVIKWKDGKDVTKKKVKKK